MGDPSGAVPGFITEALAGHAAGFGNYPAITGTEDWRQAAGDWLNRRFGLNGAIDPEKHLLPLNGTREGLFSVLFPLMPLTKGGGKADRGDAQSFLSMLCRRGAVGGRRAALCAGHGSHRLPARLCRACRQPRWTASPRSISARPPIPKARWRAKAIGQNCSTLAERHDFIVLADECYADIYFGAAAGQRPAGAAVRNRAASAGCSPFIPCPSARACRACAPAWWRAAPVLIEKFRAFRNVAAPTVPAPILAASAAAWRDEAHVAANRAAYAEKMAAAKAILGDRFQQPAGGFFLWLKTGNGEETALRLWREQGVRVLPGAYMGREILAGKTPVKPWLFLYPGRPC